MAKIIRNRTIRPSTRLATSTSYKVDVTKVSLEDSLEVNVKHESKTFHKTYHFNGQNISNKKSIHFRVIESDENIEIVWTEVQPNP